MELKKHFTSNIQSEIRIPDLGPCLVWILGKDKNGYGIVWDIEAKKQRKVHHVSWFLEFGYWPKQLNHKCNQHDCSEIIHLYEGTQMENVRDSIDNNTHARQKITMEIARKIRLEYKFRSRISSGVQLAKEYGLSITAINEIINNKTWVER